MNGWIRRGRKEEGGTNRRTDGGRGGGGEGRRDEGRECGWVGGREGGRGREGERGKEQVCVCVGGGGGGGGAREGECERETERAGENATPRRFSRRSAPHRAALAVDDAHDGGEALAAHRAAARLRPQRARAVDAHAAVPALEEDGVGRPLQADHAAVAVFCRKRRAISRRAPIRYVRGADDDGILGCQRSACHVI